LHGKPIRANALHEPAALGKAGKRRDGAARQQTEIADALRNVDRTDLADRAVERVRGGLLEPALLRAATAAHQHDVVPVPPRADHVRDQLWRILQVGADDNDGVAPCAWSSPALSAIPLPKIARQIDGRDALVTFLQRVRSAIDPSWPRR
jgi:hypothetical protein